MNETVERARIAHIKRTLAQAQELNNQAQRMDQLAAEMRETALGLLREAERQATLLDSPAP